MPTTPATWEGEAEEDLSPGLGQSRQSNETPVSKQSKITWTSSTSLFPNVRLSHSSSHTCPL